MNFWTQKRLQANVSSENYPQKSSNKLITGEDGRKKNGNEPAASQNINKIDSQRGYNVCILL